MHKVLGKCLEKPQDGVSRNQPSGPVTLEPCQNPPILSQMFVMARSAEEGHGATITTDENVCLDSPDQDDRSRNPKVKVVACSGYPRQTWLRDLQVC